MGEGQGGVLAQSLNRMEANEIGSQVGSGPTSQAEKPMGQDAALQKGLEFVFDKLGQARSCLELDLGKKGLDVFLDHLVQRGLLRVPALVECRRVAPCRVDRCPCGIARPRCCRDPWPRRVA